MKWQLLILCLFPVLQLAAQSANESIRRGNELFRQGQFAQAEKEYAAALQNKQAGHTAKFNLAATMYKMGRESAAISAYDEIVAAVSDPQLKAKAYYNKGAILSKQKKLEESIEAYKQALRYDPADKEARENLQKALLELKKKEPPKKKEEDNKKKKQQQPQKQQQPRLNQKEAEQRLKLLDQKEKQVQQRLQKEKSKSGGSQTKDW